MDMDGSKQTFYWPIHDEQPLFIYTGFIEMYMWVYGPNNSLWPEMDTPVNTAWSLCCYTSHTITASLLYSLLAFKSLLKSQLWNLLESQLGNMLGKATLEKVLAVPLPLPSTSPFWASAPNLLCTHEPKIDGKLAVDSVEETVLEICSP